MSLDFFPDIFSKFSFAHPEYFYGFLLLPLLMLDYLFRLKRKKKAVFYYSYLRFFTWVKPGLRVRFRHLIFFLRILAIGCLILVIARPQAISGFSYLEEEGIDIALALDISHSMQIQDILPDRLSVAKEKTEAFIEKRVHDRMSLIIFGKEAFLRSPLTFDHYLLKSFLQNLDFAEEVSTQTSLGNAIVTAVIALRRTEQDEPDERMKIIILITDGEDTSGDIDPLTAAYIALAYNIKIYAIGIGQPRLVQGKQPSILGLGNFMNEKSLKDITAVTGGEYFHARDKGSLERSYDVIDSIEKSRIETSELLKYEEIYEFFAILAILFFVTELFLQQLVFKVKPS